MPSGRVVGSSRTRRPFSTRARREFMRLLYGFSPRPASRPTLCSSCVASIASFQNSRLFSANLSRPIVSRIPRNSSFRKRCRTDRNAEAHVIDWFKDAVLERDPDTHRDSSDSIAAYHSSGHHASAWSRAARRRGQGPKPRTITRSVRSTETLTASSTAPGLKR